MATSIRVLVLEDNATLAEINIRELHRAGFDPQWKRVETEADFLAGLDASPDVILADYSLPQFNGLLAVKILRERGLDIPENFDLVILDMIMPKMNGPDAFRAMKKINPGIKALLSTGFSLNTEVQGILDEGVLGFIQKPFMPNDILNLITKVVLRAPAK